MKIILHLITGLDVGGAESMLLKTLPALQDQLNNHVCCIKGHGVIGAKLAQQGVPVHYLNLSHRLDISSILRFKKIVSAVKPDVLVTYLPHADIFGRLLGRLFRIPTIMSSVRVKLTTAPSYLPLFVLDGLTAPLVDQYHFNSQHVADIYHKYFRISPAKITVIPNGISVSTYQKRDARPQTPLNITSHKTVFGCVAQLRSQKGHKYLIEAFKALHDQEPDTHLVLIGNGSERDNLVDQISDLSLAKDVTILGYRSDIPSLLHKMDIFVLPTLFEGMSNALLEAMATGLPIITTDIPENRELITHGETGTLVPPRDANALTDAMITLSQDRVLQERLGTQARLASQKYDIRSVIDQYAKFLSRTDGQ